jgi:hypothetical protein
LGKGYADTTKAALHSCHTWYKWALGQAKVLHPSVTLMAGCCGGDATVATDTTLGFRSLAKTMKQFSTSVILVADDDGISKQPVDCLLARHATMRTCTTKWPAARFAVIDNLAKLARANGFEFLQTRGWFCYQYECPMVVSRRIVYRDTGHITTTYAYALTGVFRSAFRHCILDACPR